MTTKDTEERKTLEKRIQSLNVQWESAREEVYAAERKMNALSDECRALEQRLEALKPKAIRVSDHAIVRYLERQAGIDVEAIRTAILSPTLTSAVAVLGGSGRFPVNGFNVVMKDYTVTTITPQSGTPC